MRQSSLKFRPKTFARVVGQDAVKNKLISLKRKGKFPNALLFSGPGGVGKTTIARIVALSMQCDHNKFGSPCIDCRKQFRAFRHEMNVSDTTGIQDVRKFVQLSLYEIVGAGKFKVFILDEAHQLSDSAQNLLLKYIEDAPDHVLWIICTTRPDKLLSTVRERCRVFQFTALSSDAVALLVKTLLEKNQSKLDSEPLVDALLEHGVHSGRSIANAVDNYIVGIPAEEAALVDIVESAQTKPLCRAIIKADWDVTAKLLKNIDRSQIRTFRAGLFGYLLAIMLDSSEISARTTTVASGILKLTEAAKSEVEIYASFCAACYQLCKLFKGKGL